MINPLKRAAIALGVSIALVVSVFCVLGLNHSNLADFCKGLSVGLGGAAAIVIVVMLAKRKQARQNG